MLHGKHITFQNLSTPRQRFLKAGGRPSNRLDFPISTSCVNRSTSISATFAPFFSNRTSMTKAGSGSAGEDGGSRRQTLQPTSQTRPSAISAARSHRISSATDIALLDPAHVGITKDVHSID